MSLEKVPEERAQAAGLHPSWHGPAPLSPFGREKR